jgi:crotonobetainyl-CoA:carnitine CoA-transferase CaiB-like acyl-CoA transferase
MLSPYRVLDLTDDRGEMAGMVLADLGADVIKIEPPSGSPGRRRGPRIAAGPESERSLQFFAYNRNKRSIALDLADDSDRELFLKLVADSDFVLESAPPSVLDAHGLGFDSLRAANTRIVHAQITPFGSDGPRAEVPASDLTIAALGGPVSLQGVRERAPVRVTVPQVWRHAGVEAATAALVAHARMLRTGEAQFVDVSAQCAMTWTMLNGMEAAAIQGHDFERNGSMLQLGRVDLPLVFACRDGYVVMLPNGTQTSRMVGWLVEDGIVERDWLDEEWAGYEGRLLSGQPVPRSPDEVLGAFARFLRGYTKRELLERGLEESVTVAPVSTVADLLAFRHLEAREFWAKVELPDGRSSLAPGVFARAEATPLRVRRPAPRLDEHGEEIRAEVREARPDRRALPSPDGAELPFAGLKVADFSWIGVGPISARYLADHGATVVRVESETRPDNLRGAAPFLDGVPGWNRSHFFADFNASKLGLALDLKQPAAIEAARRLIAWADVFIESFTPGAVERLGLGYETARALNPEIIMMSTCLMGQSGPAARLAGYGYHAGAVAGFYEVTGWPDQPPVGPWMAYTDTIAPRFIAATLVAALDHRRRTGQGQHIDGAQLEMGLQFLAPEILDYQLSGYAATRLGNRARDAAPQGIYPCAGDDQWCAIAIDTDAQWQSLRTALGDPSWARNAELATAEGRLAAQDELDAGLSEWTRRRSAREAMDTLANGGVPAGVVQRSSDLLADPQYAHRGFHRTLEHAEMGPVPYAGHQFRIRGYASGPRSPAPLIGEHSFEILQDILGMSEDQITELVTSGALA